MRELFLKSLTMKDEQGRARSYDYAIIIDEMDVGPFACESYGVKVMEQGNGTACVLPHITTSLSRIDELCELVLSGGVTPLTLEDVVADWL